MTGPTAEPDQAPGETDRMPASNARAFGEQLERHRRELQVHCYRMLGSLEDSEDLVQEAFLRAWRGRDSFAGRSTLRAWLYRIATNACLDFLDGHPRRPRSYPLAPGTIPSMRGQPPRVDWLQPYPDRLLEPAAPADAEPELVIIARETIELAFMVALQHLPPKQRAALILRDVLGWSAADTATLLDLSVPAVKSALQRARATVREHLPTHRDRWTPRPDVTAQERAVLRRYMDAHERADVNAVATLLAEDVRVTMPPHPEHFVGVAAIESFMVEVFDPASEWYHGQWRCVPTSANRQPAVAHYVQRPSAAATASLSGEFRAQVLDVLRIEDDRVVEITSFEPQLLAAFGLPLVL